MAFTYYCYSCNSQPIYLAEVSDTESPDFDKPCCPYCNSTAVTKRDENDDTKDYSDNEDY